MTFYTRHPAEWIEVHRTRSPWWKRYSLAIWAVLLAAVLAFWAWLVMESSHVL